MDKNSALNPPTKQKKLMPVFIHSDIDELGLTLGAFRVYGHLARRAGADNFAWPSYSSIGEFCFRSSYPKAKDATLRRKAIAAVKELKDLGLVDIETRKIGNTRGSTTNAYRIIPLDVWRKIAKKKGVPVKSFPEADEELPF